MKTALDYVKEACNRNLYKHGAIPIEEAERAVQAAIDDGVKEALRLEKYRQLLIPAILNSIPNPLAV